MLRTKPRWNWRRQHSLSSLLSGQRSHLFYTRQRTPRLSLRGALGRGRGADSCGLTGPWRASDRCSSCRPFGWRRCISDGVSFLPALGKNSPSSPAVRDLLDRHQASLGRSQSFSHQQPSRSHIMRYGVLAGGISLPPPPSGARGVSHLASVLLGGASAHCYV